MKKLHSILALVLVLALALSLAACGGESGGASNGDNTAPTLTGVADDDAVTVIFGFLGTYGRVIASHNDRYAPFAETLSDTVAALRGIGLNRYTDKVGFCIVIDQLDSVVKQLCLDVLRCQSLEHRDGERLHFPCSDVFLPLLFSDCGQDKRDLHISSPFHPGYPSCRTLLLW